MERGLGFRELWGFPQIGVPFCMLQGGGEGASTHIRVVMWALLKGF